MSDWIVQTVIGAVMVPLIVFFIKIHTDLVYRTVPNGFAMLQRTVTQVQAEHQESHREAMKVCKKIRKELQRLRESWEDGDLPPPPPRGKIRRRASPKK